MIAVEEARARILAALRPVGAETLGVGDAAGRVLAAPVQARRTQPPADVSAMDGYAIRAADAAPGAVLRLVGESAAGHPFAGEVPPGGCARISTGAVIPAGADTVLIQEDAERTGDAVTVREAPAPGRWVRRRGLDFAAGEALLSPGARLTARDVGLAAAAGHPFLSVHRRPRVAILGTGDEIALPGEPLPPGGVVSSNGFALAALVRAAGGEALVLPIARDDPAAVLDAARGARGCDLLVTSGGASVGDHDHTAAALAREGFALDFWKVAMRPGKPLIFGDWQGLPVLGLPGNPVSALVCGIAFLLPALARLAGLAEAALPVRRAVCTTPLPANDKRLDHLRATLERGETWRVTPAPVQDSSMMRTFARADALILRAPHAPPLEAGAAVEVIDLAALGV